MRVAELDMTNSSHQCPSSLRQLTDSGKRTCGINLSVGGCNLVTFPVTSGYSEVCGKIIGYQVGTPDTFGATESRSIDSNYNYVDGVSLTHGLDVQLLLPIFVKTLAQSTTDDIEMRLCRDELSSNEDVAIEVVEIYVQ